MTATSYREKVRDMKRHRGDLMAGQPEVMKAFAALSDAASAPGKLDAKTKELIALGIGVANRCDECIAVHLHDALEAGATKQEVVETLGVAILMGGGPAMMYSTHAIAALKEFEAAQPA
jgi:AhpD family alkylhydroperoxidase